MFLSISSMLVAKRMMAITVVALTLAACAKAPAPSGINDPFEAENRAFHEFNLSLDQNLLRPMSTSFQGEPGPIARGVTNLAGNFALPSDIANSLLQGRLGPAVENSLRLLINTTIGIGGLFDPAGAAGVHGRPTDFGETLHVWGFAEGAYRELPVLGPSTDRDMVGTAVDIMADPLTLILSPHELAAVFVLGVVADVADRGRYSETVDSILYDSADGYAQARLLYLENRRYSLGQTISDETFVDPYEDPYGE